MEAAATGVGLERRRRPPRAGRPRSASTSGATDVEGLGGDPVAQQLELGDELGREDPLARGEDLAELDVGGTEPLEGEAEPVREPRPGPALALAPVDEEPAGDRPAEDRRDPHDPPPRWEPPAPDELGDRRPGGLAHEVEANPPGQVGGLDEPRRMVREGPDRKVGGWGRAQLVTGPNTRHPLCPPKPKLFESTGPGSKGAWRTGHDVEVDLGILLLEARRRGDEAPFDREDRGHGLEGPGGAQRVSRHALDRGDRGARAAEDLLDRLSLGEVVERRRGAVPVDVGDVRRCDARRRRGRAPCRRRRPRRRGPGR